MWTRFMDMHSGGGLKEKPYQYIHIQAPEDEAKIIFYNRFGHNPERVTCTCCGEDYSISSEKTLRILTACTRGCHWDAKKKKYMERQNTEYSFHKYMKLKDYIKQKDVLVIKKSQIMKEERVGEVPEQGYVWQG